MTGSETGAPPGAGALPGEPAWRAGIEARQQAALPSGEVLVTCSAQLGAGGLGRHAEELLAALDRRGAGAASVTGADAAPAPARVDGRFAAGDAAAAAVLQLARLGLRVPRLLRQGTLALASAREFDIRTARGLPRAEHLLAFNAQSLAQQRRARAAGFSSVGLIAANSHMRQVVRRHAQALRRYPLEQSWTRWMLARNLREYEGADVIYAASAYTRDSFLAEGFDEARMRLFPLTPDPRFDGARAERSGDVFEIVYSGSLAVHKGVPLLVDAFRRLPHADMRLRLVGGAGSRGMRRFVETAVASDPRIAAGPGDPLKALRGAALCVHAAYEDGFAYAPAEALVAGVPVIVSEDTGMKDMIGSPQRGIIVPTNDLDALTEAIEAAYRGEILGG